MSTNPFPQTAVVGASLSGHVTISTESLEKAEKKIADFFVNLANAAKPPSVVLGIRGRYGSGKTHLAHQIMQAVDIQGEPKGTPCIAIYGKADRPDLFTIYADQIVSKLRESDFRQLAAGFYRRVLKDRSDAARSNDRIPDDQSLSERAQLAVERFSKDDPEYILRLAEKNLLPSANPFGEVRDELRETDPTLVEDFVSAYSTIVEGRQQTSIALKWLRGGALTTQEVENLSLNVPRLEAKHARDALKFLLSAYRRAGIVVAFCLDELERFVEKEDSPSTKYETDAAKAAIVRPVLKDLAETFQESGQVLLLSGTDQAWDVFRDDVFHRITWENVIQVRMKHSEGEDLLRAHLKPHKLTLGDAFEAEALDLLFDVSGFIPRDVLQVAHHSFAASGGRQIKPEDVRRGTALALGDRERTAKAKRAVERAASESNLASQYVETKGESPAVLLGDPARPSVVVHLMRSMFKVEEVNDARNIASRAVEIASRDPSVRTCTVVVGYSTDAVRSALSSSVDRVLVYDEERFDAEFRDFLGWARRQPYSPAPKLVDRVEYSRLEQTAVEQESQVARVLQATVDRRVERVAEHATAEARRRMLTVLSDLARQLRNEELLWLDRRGAAPWDTLRTVLTCLDRQRDLAREAEYLNRALPAASEFLAALRNYRTQMLVAEEGWKRELGSPESEWEIRQEVERSYPKRREAYQQMESVEVNRIGSTFLFALRGWPIWKLILGAAAVAGLLGYSFVTAGMWQTQRTDIDTFLKAVRSTRDEVALLLERAYATENVPQAVAAEPTSQPSTGMASPPPSSVSAAAAESLPSLAKTRITFGYAADEFQAAQPKIAAQLGDERSERSPSTPSSTSSRPLWVDSIRRDLAGVNAGRLGDGRKQLESAQEGLRNLQSALSGVSGRRVFLDLGNALWLVPVALFLAVAFQAASSNDAIGTEVAPPGPTSEKA